MSTVFFAAFMFLALVTLVLPFVPITKQILGPGRFGLFLFTGLFIVLTGWQTALYVDGDSRGIVSTKFGSPLQGGHVVAFNGERGPQAATLGPGWNFGLWPWQYELSQNPNMPIPAGSMGLVTAKDGKALSGQAYADEWDSVEDMLDGATFGAKGFAGPQITVIPAGKTVAYNPNLFTVEVKPALIIKQNECVVIQSHHGTKAEGEAVSTSKLVPVGQVGIWDTPYGPGTHYINTEAYYPIKVNTTKRVYSYTSTSQLGASDRPTVDHSIGVKTVDGYKFPVDIRVEVTVRQDNAPHLVSEIGEPDVDLDKDGFDTLETKVILPAVRSIFRNNAEHTSALDYLNSRSTVETEATEQLREAIAEFKVDVIAVRIADIGLDSTPEGKELLTTQTDQELAKQQIKAFEEQKLAAEVEKDTVEARTAAKEQARLTESKIKIEAEENEGQAEARRAKGEAEAVREKISAYGGIGFYILDNLINNLPELEGVGPEVLVMGEGASLDPAVMAGMLQQMQKQKVKVKEVTESNE